MIFPAPAPPSGVRGGPPFVNASQLGASNLGAALTRSGKLELTLAMASSMKGATALFGSPPETLPGGRKRGTSSLCFTEGYLLLIVLTTWLRGPTHSSALLRSQFAATKSTR